MLRRAALVVLLGLAACGSRVDGDQGLTTLVDPTRVVRTGKPNDFLICPQGACAAAADAAPPILKTTAGELLETWQAVMRKSPRTRIVAVEQDEGLLLAEQRSALFGFVDRIAVKILPQADGAMSYAAYSRSLVGYYDMGVNRSRLEGWAAEVDRRLGA